MENKLKEESKIIANLHAAFKVRLSEKCVNELFYAKHALGKEKMETHDTKTKP